jgi:hypothetical protein
MKTRVILNPIDNPNRFQRSDDGYFDATALLNYYNSMAIDPKKMDDFKKLKSTKELANYLLTNELLEKKPLISSLKGTWMHPYMFIDFAMWLSVEFKVQVLAWVYDGLIKTRNQAGDYYNEMCEALMNQRNVLQKQTSFFHYIQEANMLKELSGISNRNETTESQLVILNLLQKANIKMLNMGESKERRHSELLRLKNLVE